MIDDEFRQISHFVNGTYAGVSYDNGNGMLSTFGADGTYAGTSYDNGNGILSTFGPDGTYAGTTYIDPSGMMTHYNANGEYAGTSYSMGDVTTCSDVNGIDTNIWLDSNNGDDPFL